MMTALYEDIVTFVANQLKCPICFELFTDPVTLECGHSYCLQCIKDHLKWTVRRKRCPECRAELRPDCKLHKNVTISTILELQEVGGRKMWDRVLTESDEELSQDALQKKLDFLKQEMEKIEMLQAEFHSLIQNGTCFIRDNIETYESSSVEMLGSSLDCEGGSQCAENSSSLPSVTQIDKVKNSESASDENRASVSEDPDSLGGFFEGGLSAATALSAEFVLLSFSPGLCHRRLVFLDQRRRMEVRSSMPLRKRLCHFKACQCMAEQEFTTGRHYWDVETSTCSGWAVGVAYTHLGQDERLGRSKSSWCIEWSSGNFSAWHDSSERQLKQRHPSRLRVLLDMDAGHLSFWSGADGDAELFDIQVEFSAPVRPVFWLFGTKPGNALSFPIP